VSHQGPLPPALWTLLWTCPRCLRTWEYAHGVKDSDRCVVRVRLSDQEQLACGRCGASWLPWEAGFAWQPENEAARQAISTRDALGHL
jgi:predicted amidophosphoribosyltransferase